MHSQAPAVDPDSFRFSCGTTTTSDMATGEFFETVSKADARIKLTMSQIIALDGKQAHIDSTPIKTSEYSFRNVYRIDFTDGSVLYYQPAPNKEYRDILNEKFIVQ